MLLRRRRQQLPLVARGQGPQPPLSPIRRWASRPGCAIKRLLELRSAVSRRERDARVRWRSRARARARQTTHETRGALVRRHARPSRKKNIFFPPAAPSARAHRPTRDALPGGPNGLEQRLLPRPFAPPLQPERARGAPRAPSLSGLGHTKAVGSALKPASGERPGPGGTGAAAPGPAAPRPAAPRTSGGRAGRRGSADGANDDAAPEEDRGDDLIDTRSDGATTPRARAAERGRQVAALSAPLS